MPLSRQETLINNILDIVINDFNVSENIAKNIKGTFEDELRNYKEEIPLAMKKVWQGMNTAKTRDTGHLIESLISVYKGVADIIPDNKISKRDKNIGIGYLRSELTRDKYKNQLLETFNKIKSLLDKEYSTVSSVVASRIPVQPPAAFNYPGTYRPQGQVPPSSHRY